MASGEPSPCVMKQIQMALCQLCGRDMGQSSNETKVNYQKQVDEPNADNEEESSPVPHPKPLFPNHVPLITHVPTIEYRVTSEVRHKPANIPGLLYIMNHGAMDRSDVETWVEKKKRMAERNESWVGDGTYIETHPEMLHFYGLTTHLFAKNPEKPYGNLPAPHPPYTQIVPDSRYDEIEACLKRKKGTEEKKKTFHVCLQFPGSSTSKDVKEKEDENPATVKSACLPTGGGCPPPVKMMLCLPCPPPDVPVSQPSAPKKKPRDYTYRCESRELRGGNLYQCCQCIKRNGLQHDCPRTPCQGRPACLSKPWPDCWPSGGCHGIDYTRENGLKRYDPCAEQRFDKKECKPPSCPAKPDCGGNMMIVVCPPPQPS